MKKFGNYYSQVFAEEYKYIENEKNVTWCITDDLEVSSAEFDKQNSSIEY